MFGKNDTEKKLETTRIDAARFDAPTTTSAPQQSASTIGNSLKIQGEITGAEDLTIEGRVEGTVTLKQNRVTVGKSGRVSANINAKSMIIDGEVTGDLEAAEQILVRKSGLVKGNVRAPRIVLEDGARIKGSVDTDTTENLLVSYETTAPSTTVNGAKKADDSKSSATSRSAIQ